MNLAGITQILLLILSFWALGSLIWRGIDVLFLAFLGILFAAFLSIFVDKLERWRVPRFWSAIGVTLGLIGILTGIWLLVWPTLGEQFELIRQQIPQSIDRVNNWAQRHLSGVTGMQNPVKQIQGGIAGDQVIALASGALPIFHTVLGGISAVFLGIFTGIFLAISPNLYLDGMLRVFPLPWRARLRPALVEAGGQLRSWVLGTLIGMLTMGILIGTGLFFMQIPAAFALGFIAGLLEFIPTLGPVLSSLPALAIALVLSPAKIAGVIVLFVVMQSFESNVLMPLIMRQAVHLPPALSILFQAWMAVCFGFLGLLLAVPILAAAIALLERLYIRPLEQIADG